MGNRSRLTVLLAVLLMLGCTPTPAPIMPTPTAVPPTETPIPVPPTQTPTETPDTATATAPPPTATPSPAAEVPGEPRPEAEIAILSPRPGSRVVSPVTVAGLADPTFEQTLVVRVVSADGVELALVPAMIDAMLGERGPFEIDVEVAVDDEVQAFIQVYDVSARDGGIIALESVGVTLTAGGPEDVITAPSYPQQVALLSPSTGDTVSGGLAQISAFGWAGFEQTLVVEVQDAMGAVVGTLPVTLTGDFGEAVAFTAEVPYTVETEGPGRIAIRDISPAFGGDSFVTSVEVMLAP